MEVLGIDDEGAVERVVAVLREGGTVVLPTDTVYGLAALPGGEDRLRALKGRPESVPIAVLVGTAGQAWSLASTVTPAAAALAAAYWPGPLTLVLPTDDGPTLGVRWPESALVTAVCAAVGPIATTSANRHGEPTPALALDAAATLVEPPDLVVDGGPCGGTASTVVDVSGPSANVLRVGPIPSTALDAVVRSADHGPPQSH